MPRTVRIAVLAALPWLCAGPAAARPGAAETSVSQAATTPDEALGRLRAGNERFVSGLTLRRDLLDMVSSTSEGQFPFAAVLGCIDSRVPPELVFDSGIGDIFATRTAGNVADDTILGGLEFATKVAGGRVSFLE